MVGCGANKKNDNALETDTNVHTAGEINYDFNAPAIYIDFPNGSENSFATTYSSIDLDARCDGDISKVWLMNATTDEVFEGFFDKNNGTCPIKGVILIEGDNVLNATNENFNGTYDNDNGTCSYIFQ